MIRSRFALLLGLTLAATSFAAACSTEEATKKPRTGQSRKSTDPVTGQELPDYNDPHVTAKEGIPDPFEGMARGAAQNDALCTRVGPIVDTNQNFNAVTNMLCKEKPAVTSITELLVALGIDFKNRQNNATNGSNGNPGFALLGHSSSLVARNVSAINPRAFVFTGPPGAPAPMPGYVAIGFTRGEPFVEIAAHSPKAGKLSLYLFKFDMECEQNHNCTNKDLFTPAIESGWKGFTVYDDEDLKNNLMDCRHCHQPNGPSSKMMLRMQELELPWTHWFRNDLPGGITLAQDFIRAHGRDEDYGGIPAGLIGKSDGKAIEDLVKGQGFDNQPNVFDTVKIEKEIKASSDLQPEINTPKGKSSTWEANYARAMAGEFIPVPYHDVKVSDPDKLDFLSKAYEKFRNGEPGELPDMRRVFLDDALEAMTIYPKSGATGRQVLVQTCAQCHNPKLDQTVTRAKFDAMNLDSMSRAEKDLAIARLKMGSAERLRMPPVTMRSLPDDAREAAIQELLK
jgi:hypothetical protein